LIKEKELELKRLEAEAARKRDLERKAAEQQRAMERINLMNEKKAAELKREKELE
jgi:hypothetical protein